VAHLTPDAMLDLVEGIIDARADSHLASCEACRAQVTSLRATLTEIEAGQCDIPEPSPLFWDHLSARVRAAVAEPTLAVPWWRLHWQPAVLATTLCAALVLALFLRESPEPVAPSPMLSTAVASSPEVEAVEPDESLDWLTDLASGVSWDDDSLLPQTTDLAVGDLNDDERVELHRLLQEALAGAGV
jgi:hypothetical protein